MFRGIFSLIILIEKSEDGQLLDFGRVDLTTVAIKIVNFVAFQNILTLLKNTNKYDVLRCYCVIKNVFAQKN